jgi:hypothetical protein
MTRSSTDVCRQIRTRGWAPALWAHHPSEVKDAIRRMRWRPQVKQCFANCQRFLLAREEHGLNVEYREGYVQNIIPVPHAWLIYQGEILELTLDPDRNVKYLQSYAVSTGDVLDSIFKFGVYRPVFEQRLGMLHPLRKQFEKLKELMDHPNPQEWVGVPL